MQVLYRKVMSQKPRGVLCRYGQVDADKIPGCTWTLDGPSAFLRKELHCGRTRGEVLRRAHQSKAGNKRVSQKAVPAYVVSNTETIWKRVNSQLSMSARRY